MDELQRVSQEAGEAIYRQSAEAQQADGGYQTSPPSADQHEPGKKTLTTKIGFDATIPSDVDKKKYEVVKYKKVDLDDYLR